MPISFAGNMVSEVLKVVLPTRHYGKMLDSFPRSFRDTTLLTRTPTGEEWAIGPENVIREEFRFSNEQTFVEEQNVDFSKNGIAKTLEPAAEGISLNQWNQGSSNETLNQEDRCSVRVNSSAYASLVRGCSSLKDGQSIHEQLVKKRLEGSMLLGSLLIHMYFRCGAPEDALATFGNMSNRNVYSWNYIIQAYARQGQGGEPLHLFDRMQQEGVMPNKVTLTTIIDACGSQAALHDGKRIHGRILESRFEPDVLCGTALVNMYAKCGKLNDALDVFHIMPVRDVISWTAMISILVEHRQGKAALQLFHKMQQEGVMPSTVTFVSILGACAKHTALAEGEEMHARIVSRGFESDVIMRNALVNMYGKCGELEKARAIFDKMPERNVVSWTSMLALYAQNRCGKAVVLLFNQMQCEAVIPNKVTFVNILAACASEVLLDEGKRVHARIWDSKFESDVVVGTALVNMYGKCGNLVDSCRIFDSIPHQDLMLWNTMIAVYAQNGRGKDAIQLFENMQKNQIKPDKLTLASILNACASCGEPSEGKRMHAYVLESGLELEVVVGNALIHLYGQFGGLDHARKIFDKMPNRDVVSWTAMIAEYVKQGQGEDALQLFDVMEQEGFLPDRVTFVTILDAFAGDAALAHCQQVHVRILESRFDLDIVVGNALVSMYGKCGSLEDARRVFDMLLERDVVSWNALIAAYSEHGYCEEALDLFAQLIQNEIRPTKVTFISILTTCASQTLLAEGKQINSCIVDSGLELDIAVGTALLTMYGKCGCLEDAKRIFEKMPERNAFSWNAMMAVYAQNGQGKEAVGLFHRMQQEMIKPDMITFMAILVACSHAGMVNEALNFFASITQDHGILPVRDHCVCMIDLLGRAGLLDEAENLIQNMPFQPATT